MDTNRSVALIIAFRCERTLDALRYEIAVCLSRYHSTCPLHAAVHVSLLATYLTSAISTGRPRTSRVTC